MCNKSQFPHVEAIYGSIVEKQDTLRLRDLMSMSIPSANVSYHPPAGEEITCLAICSHQAMGGCQQFSGMDLLKNQGWDLPIQTLELWSIGRWICRALRG